MIRVILPHYTSLPCEDARFPSRQQCLENGYASLAVVPIRNQEQILGLLQCCDQRKGRFTLSTVELLEGIATRIGETLARKQAETLLQEAKELLTLFIHHAPIYAYIKEVTSNESRVWQASENFQQLTGIPGPEMVGKTMGELFPAAVAAKMTADDWSVVSEGKRLECEENLNDRSFTTLKFPIVQGKKTLLAGFTIDITARKQAEEDRRQSDTEYRRLVWHMPVGVLVQGPQAEIRLSNPQALELLGMSENQLLGITSFDPAWNVIHEDGSPFPGPTHPVPQALATRQPVRETIMGVFRPANGDRIWLSVDAEPQLNDDGTVRQVICTFIDITRRKQAEADKVKLQAQLVHAQKLESLGRLAGGVAHDMNNVLGAILGMASANIEAQPVASPTYRAFDTISKAAIRGGQMVKSLLSFARKSPVEELELDMNAVLREEVHLLEHTTLSKIHLELDLGSELRLIRGDASALTHAFMNLCVNAVDAMPTNGTLTLRTRNVDNDWIEVLVEDTGDGMSEAVLDQALDPFFTTKAEGQGTGLGLALVYSTVLAHHGQMDIESEPGQGTRVRMRFPACARLAQSHEPTAELPKEPSQGALNVLLVDDDELIQSSLQELLAVLGHKVTGVYSGEEALANLAAGLEPEVVILDMNMPGLGGAGTLPRLRALCPTLPVLLSTGRADEAAVNLIRAYPFVTLLSKPFTMKELQRHLQKPKLG